MLLIVRWLLMCACVESDIYDRSISPFNIQDEFKLPNFTLKQARELLAQYTKEVGQPFEPAVIESIHKQTTEQPVLVNRFAQNLTENRTDHNRILFQSTRAAPARTEHTYGAFGNQYPSGLAI